MESGNSTALVAEDSPTLEVRASGRRLPPAERVPAYAWTGVGLLTLGVTLALLVFNDSAALAATDLSVVSAFFELAHRVPALQSYAAFNQTVGSGNVTGPVVALAVMALLVARRFRWAGWLGASALGGLVISEVLKHAVHRQRPVWSDPFFTEKGYSFPSGHSLSGITAWVAMGIVVLYLLPRPVSTVLGWILVAFGVLMGLSRLAFGVHWPTDVLGGWLFGCGWLLVVTAAALALAYRRERALAES